MIAGGIPPKAGVHSRFRLREDTELSPVLTGAMGIHFIITDLDVANRASSEAVFAIGCRAANGFAFHFCAFPGCGSAFREPHASRGLEISGETWCS